MTTQPLSPTEEMRKWIDLCKKLFEETPEADREKLFEALERLRNQPPTL